MKLLGKLLKIEHKSGSFTPEGESSPRDYDFHVLHVLEGHVVREVRLPREVSPQALPYVEGDEVELTVEVPKNTRVILSAAALAGV